MLEKNHGGGSKMYKRLLVTVLMLLLVLPCVASAADLTGKLTYWKQGREYPLTNATVVVGKDIWLKADGATDVVKGAVTAKTTTDENGRFILSGPAGKYLMIIWKANHIPSTGISVSLPGTHNDSISYDNQPGASSRHVYLRFGN
jgi:hypothetical protein